MRIRDQGCGLGVAWENEGPQMKAMMHHQVQEPDARHDMQKTDLSGLFGSRNESLKLAVSPVVGYKL